MNARDVWAKVCSGAIEAGRLVREILSTLWHVTRRIGIRLRPHVTAAGAWLRPRAARTGARLGAVWARMGLGWAWLVPRVRRGVSSTATSARLSGKWLRERGSRLGRGLLTLARKARGPARLAARTLLIAAAVGGLVLGSGWAFVRRTPPGTIAVRQAQWGASGVVERDFGPGLHWTLTGRDVWYELPARTHLVSFAAPAEGGSHAPLEVATREGEGAQVAVIVPYRIRPGSGWRLVADGLRGDYAERAVAICRRVLLEELAALSAAEFSDTQARAEIESRALARLDEELGVTHLEPLDVRIGSIFFQSTYEKKLLEKQLESQDELTRLSIAQRKTEQSENDRVLQGFEDAEAGWVREYALQREQLIDAHKRRIQEIARTSKQYQARERSRSKVRVLELKNEGDLALAAAVDLRESLFSSALESGGGRLHIAREAAENLKFGRVTLNSNDPGVPSVLDLDELVELLMGADRE